MGQLCTFPALKRSSCRNHQCLYRDDASPYVPDLRSAIHWTRIGQPNQSSPPSPCDVAVVRAVQRVSLMRQRKPARPWVPGRKWGKEGMFCGGTVEGGRTNNLVEGGGTNTVGRIGTNSVTPRIWFPDIVQCFRQKRCGGVQRVFPESRFSMETQMSGPKVPH